VTNALTPRQFTLRLPDVPDEFDFIDQGLVLIDAENHGGALAVLGQKERALGRPDLVQKPAAFYRNADSGCTS
jgi:hypothetical protein